MADREAYVVFVTDVAALLGLHPYKSRAEALRDVRDRSDRYLRSLQLQPSKLSLGDSPATARTRLHRRRRRRRRRLSAAMEAGVRLEGAAIRRFEAASALRCVDMQRPVECAWTFTPSTAATRPSTCWSPCHWRPFVVLLRGRMDAVAIAVDRRESKERRTTKRKRPKTTTTTSDASVLEVKVRKSRFVYQIAVHEQIQLQMYMAMSQISSGIVVQQCRDEQRWTRVRVDPGRLRRWFERVKRQMSMALVRCGGCLDGLLCGSRWGRRALLRTRTAEREDDDDADTDEEDQEAYQEEEEAEEEEEEGHEEQGEEQNEVVVVAQPCDDRRQWVSPRRLGRRPGRRPRQCRGQEQRALVYTATSTTTTTTASRWTPDRDDVDLGDQTAECEAAAAATATATDRLLPAPSPSPFRRYRVPCLWWYGQKKKKRQQCSEIPLNQCIAEEDEEEDDEDEKRAEKKERAAQAPVHEDKNVVVVLAATSTAIPRNVNDLDAHGIEDKRSRQEKLQTTSSGGGGGGIDAD